jgi:hypothetical protein
MGSQTNSKDPRRKSATPGPGPEAGPVAANVEMTIAKPTYPDIVVAIFHVDTLSEPIEFHWAFFVQYPGKEHGLKLHATDISDYWEFDTWPFTLSSSESVAAAVVIGQVPPNRTIEDLERILKSIPMDVVPVEDSHWADKFDCRIWLREGVRRLVREGWIKCRDVNALEDEVQMYGEATCRELNRGTPNPLRIQKSRFSS